MPNSYFRFKQFTIDQDRCAMKVGTDGVLLGGWSDLSGVRTVLDIGTGTGLIGLMLAQRGIDAQVDAVEIDEASAIQAKENVQRSPWADRVRVHHQTIQSYAMHCERQYDLIVSNPPFFENSSKAPIEERTVARHNDTLKPLDLLKIVQQLLRATGKFCVIYPTETAQQLPVQAARFGLYCTKKLSVKPTPNRPVKRVLMEFRPQQAPCVETMIVLELSRHLYTPEFIELVRDFYLKY